jgi:hypothetical protein
MKRTRTTGNNFATYKAGNKRVSVAKEDESYVLQFKILDCDDDPRALHHYKHGVTFTTFKLTLEALEMTFLAIKDILEKEYK